MTRCSIRKTAWTIRAVLALASATYPASAFAQSTGMVRIGAVLVPTAYIFIGGAAIIGVIVAASIALGRRPKRSRFRLDWKFTCPRCSANNTGETPVSCKNCGNGAVKADYYTSPHGSTKASFGCTNCEQYSSAPKCSSCGADAANRMLIQGRLSWFRPDFYN